MGVQAPVPPITSPGRVAQREAYLAESRDVGDWLGVDAEAERGQARPPWLLTRLTLLEEQKSKFLRLYDRWREGVELLAVASDCHSSLRENWTVCQDSRL